MKVIFFGLGSIGTRHAEILKKNFDHELFAFRTFKGQQKSNQLGIAEVSSWAQVNHLQPEVAFITNPTYRHIETALECAKRGMHLFIEKPIDCSTKGLDRLIQLARRNGQHTYVAYNLRFHPVIEYLQRQLKGKKLFHVSVQCTSRLAEWRQGYDHRQCYSAHHKMGGGVLLDLSHEFDYIEYLFGPIMKIVSRNTRLGDVTRDADDTLDAIIQTRRTQVNLHQNLYSYHQERTLKIDFRNGFLAADLIGNRVEGIVDGKKIRQSFPVERNQTYRRQLEYFFQQLRGKRKMMNHLEEAEVLYRKLLKIRMSS